MPYELRRLAPPSFPGPDALSGSTSVARTLHILDRQKDLNVHTRRAGSLTALLFCPLLILEWNKMANNKPPLSFGQAGSTSSSSNVLGLTSTAPALDSLPGRANTMPTGSSNNLFGSTQKTAPPGSLFGAPTTESQGGIFGFSPLSQPVKGASPFQATPTSSAAPSSGGMFSSSSNTLNAGTTSSASASNSIFATPNKPAETPTTSQPTANFFGGSSTTSDIFGKPAEPPNTTPTSKPTTSFFANSTTPAGPPPNVSNTTSQSLFAFPPKSISAPSPSFQPLNASSITSIQPQSVPQPTASAQPGNLFAPAGAAKATSNPFGIQQDTSGNTSRFSNLGKSQPSKKDESTPQSSQTETKAAQSLFANLETKTTSESPSTNIASLFTNPSSQSPFGLGKPAEATSAAISQATTASLAPTSAFGGLFANPATSAPPAKSVPTTSPFPSLTKPQDKPAISTRGFNNNATGTTSAGTASSSPFTIGKPAPDLSGTTSAQNNQGTAEDAKASITYLSASTTGPAPPARSRLKDKTMDDIITRWASDLSKYQKQFQIQAEKVAQWDRSLVENSEQIQRLYGSTLEAERATTEVERQLTSVESDQAELEQWLDYYEKEVNQIMDNSLGQGEPLTGPDGEREKTWAASNLTCSSEANTSLGSDWPLRYQTSWKRWVRIWGA